MATLVALLEAGFQHWDRSGELEPKLLDCGGFDEYAVNAFAAACSGHKHPHMHKLFVAVLMLARGNIVAAANWFATAFTDCSALLSCEEAEEIDAIAEIMTPSSTLAAILLLSKPADGILRVLVHRHHEVQLLEERYKAAVAHAKPSPPCTIQQAAQYCYAKIVEDGKPYKEDFLVHKALFWAVAGWACWKHTALILAMPKRHVNGPWFEELAGLLKQFRGHTAPSFESITDVEVLRVLDSAIEHVRSMCLEQACDETHFEPLWIITPHTQTMDALVHVYSTRDATGALHRIFPWLFAQSELRCGAGLADTAFEAPALAGITPTPELVMYDRQEAADVAGVAGRKRPREAALRSRMDKVDN